MSKKILMIDDDDELVESVKILLEAKGYEFLSAPSSAEGFEMAKKEQPSLILLDVMMTHDSDGLDGAVKLKNEKLTADIPVIMMTGIRKPDNLLESYASDEKFSNIKGVYEKPLKPETLIKLVNKHVR
ncbi:MAG TPA: response regulator [Candidatus Eremiobacteraeota bacterium]|nr:MAG: Transcriptional regulatory protein SrrA [bacterium ADurb.Bin363]HPZ09651.1 response regulator [Candidatus Eremiobacteraeota bacterium]